MNKYNQARIQDFFMGENSDSWEIQVVVLYPPLPETRLNLTYEQLIMICLHPQLITIFQLAYN